MANDAFIARAEQLALDPDLVRQVLVAHPSDEHSRCRAHHSRRESHSCSIRSPAGVAALHRTPSSGCDAAPSWSEQRGAATRTALRAMDVDIAPRAVRPCRGRAAAEDLRWRR